MKVLASLLRVVFSIIILLMLTCYLQTKPTISLSEFCASIAPTQLLHELSGFNATTVLLVIIILLGILPFGRILEAVWNMLFCVAILMLLACGLYAIGGPGAALPRALYHNLEVNQFMMTLASYEVPIALATLIFIIGWLCASACGRVAITTVVSYGLWYGLTEFFTFLVQQWADSSTPRMPEALHMVQNSPWILAAIPAAFFLIYALLMAFFETYIDKTSKSGTKSSAEPLASTAAESTETKPEATSTKPEQAGKPETPAAPKAKEAPAVPPAEAQEPEKPAAQQEPEQSGTENATEEATQTPEPELPLVTETKEETPEPELPVATETKEETAEPTQNTEPEAAEIKPEEPTPQS